jgi:hypothetical protein
VKYLLTEDLPIDELTPLPGNPRRGDVEQIRGSLIRYGQFKALVVRQLESQQVVLSGNHTRAALLGLADHPPDLDGLLASWPPGSRDEHIADAQAFLAQLDARTARCELIECDDDEARRISLAANRLGEIGTYDDSDLAAMLLALGEDYDATGFDDDLAGEVLSRSGMLGDAASDFLSGELGGDGEDPDGQRRPEGEFGRGDWVLVSWLVPQEDRAVIRRAVTMAQQNHDLESSAQAIAALARDYLAQLEAPVD